MGLTDGDDHGLKGRALERERRSIGPRTAKALRLMLGLTIADVASRAGVLPDLVERVEAWPAVDCEVRSARRAISDTFAAMGGHWCEAATHDGAHCVYLAFGGAGDRQAILALMALMPVTVAALFRRVAKRAGREQAVRVRDALNGKAPLTTMLVWECRYLLGNRDGCAGGMFEQSDEGGWRYVGCDSAGALWNGR